METTEPEKPQTVPPCVVPLLKPLRLGRTVSRSTGRSMSGIGNEVVGDPGARKILARIGHYSSVSCARPRAPRRSSTRTSSRSTTGVRPGPALPRPRIRRRGRPARAGPKGPAPLAIAEAVAVIEGGRRGAQYAAGRALIHRDIKPANLLLTPEGQVKIIDLGLALQAEDEDERVTRDGTTVGTVDYMAPEQARDSRATSERSDIYSLGCTFYFLLTGSPAVSPAATSPTSSAATAPRPPPIPSAVRPEVPGPLALLVRRMMAKSPRGGSPTTTS